MKVTSDLFDIMSGQTDVDHPLCEECTDTLLDHLDTQLNITENECQNYKQVHLDSSLCWRSVRETRNLSLSLSLTDTNTHTGLVTTRKADLLSRLQSVTLFTIFLQAVSGAAVKSAGGGRGNPAG